jgi:hypothetical protein
MKLPSILLAASVLAVSGCAYMQREQAADSENILAEAGFKKTELEADGLKTVHPLQLARHGDHYDFDDPRFCKCRYTGGESERKVLNDLRAARVKQHERSATAIGVIGADEMGWGPWKPDGLDAR